MIPTVYRDMEGVNKTLEIDSNQTGMTWFRAFRGDFGYSHYGEFRTSVTMDIPFATIIYTCVLLSIAALVAAAGIRGKERWYTLVRLTYTLAVGSIILVSLFGYCWQTGSVRVHSPYIYRSESHINGVIGVRVGLKTVNITLSGTFSGDVNSFKYNEELVLDNVIDKVPQLWAALERGLPQPLLSILEHFDIDEGGLRYGRSNFMAGHFAYILLWTAFAFWITANILLCSVVWYGAACFTLSGLCMIMAAGIYDLLAPQTEVKMPCSEGTLQLTYGWCFWSTLVFGIMTTLIGLILFTLDQKVPKMLAQFFVLDTSYEDNSEDYKQINTSASLHPDTPNTSIRLNENEPKRKQSSSTPVNWYINYGYDNNANHKGNPIYTETVTADSPVSIGLGSNSNSRVFKNITEEEETGSESGRATSSSPISMEKDSEIKSGDTLNRLTQIYADVEPNLRRVSRPSLGDIFGQELNGIIINK